MNLFFSLLSALLVLMLELLYPMRKLAKRSAPAAVYKLLHKTHIIVGMLVIPVVFCHCGITKSVSDKETLLGGPLLILLLLLAASYALRKRLGRCWLPIHRALAAAVAVLTLYHGIFEFM